MIPLIDILRLSFSIALLSFATIFFGLSIWFLRRYRYLRKKYNNLYVLYEKLKAMDENVTNTR